MRSEEHDRVLHFLDEDGDGETSASDLSQRLGQTGGELALNEEMELKDAIELMEGGEEKMYDEDGSGVITPRGLNTMLTKLGEWKYIDESMVMIKQFDLDGDGLISFEEFKVTMQY